MRLQSVLAVVVAVIGGLVAGAAARAEGGDTQVYVKSGWFRLHETLDGATFVKDEGWMHGAGVKSREETRLGLSFEGGVEVWGGDLGYEGHDLRNTVPLNSRTSYLGTREELAVGVPLLSGAIEPFVAAGHKFFIRSRSGEDWNVIYVKGGMEGKLRLDRYTLFARGGVLYPVFTRNHADLSGSGFADVVTYPRSALAGFGEAGVQVGRISISVEYEGTRFRRSPDVAIQPNQIQSGVAIQATHAFQPETAIDSVFLRLGYSF